MTANAHAADGPRRLRLADDAREEILRNPDVILSDPEVMRVLLAAPDGGDRKVVDLRGVLIERLERRLGRLVEAHRDVLDAAWENLAGMDQIHRTALTAMDAPDAPALLRFLRGDASDALDVVATRLCVERPVDPARFGAAAGAADTALIAVSPTTMAAHLAAHRTPGAPSRVALQSAVLGDADIFSDLADVVRSTASIRLDLEDRAALLVFGAAEPQRFHEEQGAELLDFFGAVLERTLRRLAPAAR